MATGTLTHFVRYLQSIAPEESDSALLSRFAGAGEQDAFAEILRRHGSVVLGVCRRILSDSHAAEDAFQATFLLLARKAGQLRQPELLANWLYGVAYRTAVRLRAQRRRRQAFEQPFENLSSLPDRGDDDAIIPNLDAAIQQLPSKYRVPIVLCYFHGLTHSEAAMRLGCPPNTVATRLARARQRLRIRLTRQGLTVAVTSALASATVQNASALVSGAPVAPHLLTIMEGIQRTMMWNKVKVAVTLAALLGAAGIGINHLTCLAIAEDAPVAPAPRGPAAPLPGPGSGGGSPSATNRIPATDVTTAEVPRNFVVTGATDVVCASIAESAEKQRKELAKLWLGKELPDWKKPCPIRATISSAGPRSATSFDFGPQWQIIEMILAGSRNQILDNILPHEVMHTVLADHFRRPVPRWADEGMAILCETDSEQKRHDEIMVKLLRDGRAFRLSSLLQLTDYPADVIVVYDQGYSVTRFLVEQKDRPTFLQFLKAGMKDGWDAATKVCYGFESVNEMEREWLTWMKTVGKKAKPPIAPAPTTPTANYDPPPSESGPPTIPPPAEAQPPSPVAPASDTPPPLPPTQAPLPPASNDPLSPAQPPVSPSAPPTPALSQPVPPLPPRSPIPPIADLVGAPAVIAVQASMSKDGMVVCKFQGSVQYHEVTSYVRGADKTVRPVTTYIRRSTQEERSFLPDQIQVLGLGGVALDAKELAKHLEKETWCLFTQSAGAGSLRPVLKEGTLIITLKNPLPQPAPAMPAAPPQVAVPATN